MAVTSPFFFNRGREGQKALAHVATLGSAGGCGQDGGRDDGGDGGDGCGSGGPWKSTVEAVVTVQRWACPCRASGESATEWPWEAEWRRAACDMSSGHGAPVRRPGRGFFSRPPSPFSANVHDSFRTSVPSEGTQAESRATCAYPVQGCRSAANIHICFVTPLCSVFRMPVPARVSPTAGKTEGGDVFVNLGLRLRLRDGFIDCPPPKRRILRRAAILAASL
eukprot:scaffold1772_cov97-Phaeocystis_antarctica.AAC.2